MRISFKILSFSIATLCLAACPIDSGGGGSSGPSGTQPRIVSVPPTSATAGALYRYQPTVTGNPTPTVDVGGFPGWLVWDGTALSGTPSAGDVGTTPQIAVSASNGIGEDAQQTLSIAVVPNGGGGGGGAPQITSTANTSATVGVLYEYNISTTGSPAPVLSQMNAPAWLSLNGATLSGTPAAGDVGSTPQITLTATNGVSPDASQSFSITVAPAPSSPVLTFGGSAMPTEGDAGGMLASVEVVLNPRTQTPVPTVSVDYATSDGTAIETDD